MHHTPEKSATMEHTKLRDLDAVEKAMNLYEQLVHDCPDPSQEEIRKMLTVQGAFLMSLAMQLMADVAGKLKVERKMRLALKMFQQSEKSLVAASKVRLGPKNVPELPQETPDLGED